MQKLREVLAHALDEFLSSAQQDALIERCFPGLAKTHGDVMRVLLLQALSFVKANGMVRAFIPLHSS